MARALKAADEMQGFLRRLRERLTVIADRQPDVLKKLAQDGFVFDEIGNEPGNWKHLAFWLYTDLCELSHAAEGILEEMDELGVK